MVAIDVLHDLAIVRDQRPSAIYFSLLPNSLAQGTRLYSMGNPRDLGMTIIEGNYNGLLKSSRFERILFSGSLNPGMSGGPAFNQHGEVVGVNVTTGGEQLSFLVPAKQVQALVDKSRDQVPGSDFKAEIGRELVREAESFYLEREREPWRRERFGELLLPRDLSPALKC